MLGNSYFAREVSGEYVAAIGRLSVLLHEARYADGKNKVFLHSYCLYSEVGTNCDACSNGPYTVESLFYQSVKESNSSCQKIDSILLEILSILALKHVLSGATECDDSIDY